MIYRAVEDLLFPNGVLECAFTEEKLHLTPTSNCFTSWLNVL